MPDPLHHAIDLLRDPVGTRRREMLLDMEHGWSADQQRRFAALVLRLDEAARCDLCNALAMATAAPLVELLGDLALASSAAVRARACAALAEVPAPRRQTTLIRLLSTTADATVLVAAIRLISQGGDTMTGLELLRTLDHADDTVPLAALAALRQLNCRAAVPRLARLLAHPGSAVRMATLETLAELAEDPAALGPALSLLVADGEVAVRATAATVLGRRQVAGAQAALEQVFTGDDEVQVRIAAARALAGHAQPAVVELLLRHCRHPEAAVALACREGLDGMPPALLVTVCGTLAQDPDPALRMELAACLGTAGTPAAGELLATLLDIEPDAVVRAAQVEALGRCGGTDAWDLLMSRTSDEPVVAFAALAALGERLDAEHFDDFAALLDTEREGALVLAILTRLLVAARAQPLPAAELPRLVPYLDGIHGSGAEQVAEILGHLDAPVALHDLFRTLGSGHDRPTALTEACVQSILRLVHHQLDVLIEAAHPDHLVALAVTVGRMRSLGTNGTLACLRLAELVRSGRSEAVASLDVAAGIEPATLVQAIRQAHDDRVVPLLDAWRRLPAQARERSPLELTWLLGAEAPALRIAALGTLDQAAGDQHLNRVVDLALGDGDEGVRRHARLAARRIVGC